MANCIFHLALKAVQCPNDLLLVSPDQLKHLWYTLCKYNFCNKSPIVIVALHITFEHSPMYVVRILYNCVWPYNHNRLVEQQQQQQQNSDGMV